MFIFFVIGALVLITVFVVGIISLRLFYFTDEKAVAEWAKKNNYTVLHLEKRKFSESPFSKLSFDSDQRVYFISFKNDKDETKSGWIRCHGLEKGIIMERVEFIEN